MNLLTKQEYTVPKAAKEAVDILEEEANQLASVFHKEESKHYSNRTQIAINREIQRLRAIANSLKTLAPKTEDDTED